MEAGNFLRAFSGWRSIAWIRKQLGELCDKGSLNRWRANGGGELFEGVFWLEKYSVGALPARRTGRQRFSEPMAELPWPSNIRLATENYLKSGHPKRGKQTSHHQFLLLRDCREYTSASTPVANCFEQDDQTVRGTIKPRFAPSTG